MSEFQASNFKKENGGTPDLLGKTELTSPYFFVPPSGDTASRPTNCAAGTWSDVTGRVAECTECGIGKWSDVLGAISEDTCNDCPAGTWNDTTGQTVCTNCTMGTWSDTIGATDSSTCQGCLVNETSEPGTISIDHCHSCPENTYSNNHKNINRYPCKLSFTRKITHN